MISIFVAIDDKRGIGKNNDLLFKIPEDFRRMKELTTGHPIIMGRRTFESIGRVLPNRTNIVITRNPKSLENLPYQPHVIVLSLEDALRQAQGENKEIFIFGGGQIFKEAIEKGLVDRLYLTVVEGDYGADVFFPGYSEFKKVISEEAKEADGYKYKFLTLEK